MTELALIFVAGLLGSSHCLGMCGGFALTVGLQQRKLTQTGLAQLSYSVGRIFTYTVLGAICGFVGNRVSTGTVQWINTSAVLCLIAGLFLIYQGLGAAGIRLWGGAESSTQGCLTGSFLKSFLQSPDYSRVFLAGMLNGFLPCGLLYGFLALAAASQDLIGGALIMATFGLGTVPLMVSAGFGGRLLSLVARRRLLKVAAWSVVVTGALTTIRGAGAIQSGTQDPVSACPFCSSEQSEY